MCDILLSSSHVTHRQLDSHEEPMILVRKHAVLISLSPLRAIVTADRVILSVPDGADALLYILHDYLNGQSSTNLTLFYFVSFCSSFPPLLHVVLLSRV